MKYQVILTAKAEQALVKLNKTERKRIYAAIELLAVNPRPPKSRKVLNTEYLRVRVGDYRIIYQVSDDQLIIYVVKIGHRKVVYRSL
jgi:mRNA interferase RelE/StbE